MKSRIHVIEVAAFGQLSDGREAHSYTLINQNGMRVLVSDYGATLVSVFTPDRDGEIQDLLHGYDSVDGYAGSTNPYFGNSVGRFGNRICDGKFTLDGKDYTLETNNDPGGVACHLHGGVDGFNRRLWTVSPMPKENAITFTYVSVDGEEGYPGTLTTHVTYRLNDDNELSWTAVATTDAPTILNIVQHAYWNLSGDHTTTINDHVLMLPCDRYLPTNEGLIPTGELATVANTPMDFTQPTEVGARLNQKFEALEFAGGYDHCWVLEQPDANGLALAARVKDSKSGRVMELHTNQTGVQFYGGNFLNPEDFQGAFASGKDGLAYEFRTALCLETEGFPDAPNQSNFPSTVLRPGETYEHRMLYRFSAE
jgi:aldose 1-epimerase